MTPTPNRPLPSHPSGHLLSVSKNSVGTVSRSGHHRQLSNQNQNLIQKHYHR